MDSLLVAIAPCPSPLTRGHGAVREAHVATGSIAEGEMEGKWGLESRARLACVLFSFAFVIVGCVPAPSNSTDDTYTPNPSEAPPGSQQERWCIVNEELTDYRGCYASRAECSVPPFLTGHRCRRVNQPWCFSLGALFECFGRKGDCDLAAKRHIPSTWKAVECRRAWPSDLVN